VIAFRAMTSVYCYHYPEVRRVMRDVESRLPDSMYLVTTPSRELSESLRDLFQPPLDIPATPDGHVSLDEIHVPIMERIIRAYGGLVPALGVFPHRYPTPGSTEGIFKLLVKLKVDGVDAINVLDGDYEGYGEYAGPQDLKMIVNRVSPAVDVDRLQPGFWFISNPSACDGNILANSFIRRLCDAGHRVVLDLSYAKATRAYSFDVDHPNVIAVLLSLSKPYGLFRFRIGFTFTREPLHSLFGNKWFKDPARLLQGLKVVEEVGPDERGSTKLYEAYRPVQLQIIDEINREHGLGMKASDSHLLGHMLLEDAATLSPDQLALIEPYRRGAGYRFCLTPYFEERERHRASP